MSHQVGQYISLCVFNQVRDGMIELAFSPFHFAFCVCMFQFLICTINYYNLDTTPEKKKKHCHSPNVVFVWKLNAEHLGKLLKLFFRHRSFNQGLFISQFQSNSATAEIIITFSIWAFKIAKDRVTTNVNLLPFCAKVDTF